MRKSTSLLAVIVLFLCLSIPVHAQEFPSFSLPVIEGVRIAKNGQEASTSLMLILLVSILSLAPALILMVTSYTKIIIVLDFVRRALALQNMPPNQVLFSLALFLTFFIMAPTIEEFNKQALEPYLKNNLSTVEFIKRGIVPFRKFMIQQLGKEGGKEIALFITLARKDPAKIQTLDDIDTYILIPAFMLSEMKKAFIIGVLIFIPFVVIDLVISSTLMSMGMIMLPPAIISLPFKIILFILVDGWHLITYNLVRSYM